MVQITVLNKTGSVQQILNSKEAGANQLAQLTGSKIKIGHSEVVKVEVNPDQVAKIERVANDAVITLKNGEQITLEGFFDAADNRLILQEGEKAWQVEGLQQAPAGELAISYLPVDTASSLAITESGGVSDSLLAWGAGLLGVGAIAGIAANSGGSGGGSSAPADTTPPVAGKLGLKGFDDSGVSTTDHLSRDNSFKLQLAGQEAGTTVKYQLSTDGGKTWKDSTRDQSALADGVYQFRAVVTDKAGNTATSNVETVTVDRQTTAGSLSLSSYNDTGISTTDHISRDQNFKLQLSGQEAGSTVQYQLSTDGGKTWKDSTLDQSALADGVYQFRAVVTDKAGNTATSNVETVTVDRQTSVGSLSLTSYNDSGSSATDHISRDQNFKLQLSGQEAGSTVQYQLSTDGGKTWVDSTRDQSALADGVYHFRAVVTDKAGNTAISNVEKVTVDRTIDTSKIQLVIDSVTADNTLDLVEAQQTQLISGSLKNLPADIENYQLSLLVGGQSYALTVDATTGQWSAQVPGSVLWQSENIQASLQLTDKAGNQTVLNIDKAYALNPVPEAPAQLQATIDTLFNDIIVTGTAFAGSEIKVKDAAGNVLASGTAKADGSFELFFNNGFVDGQKVNVTATVNGHESVIAQSKLVQVSPLLINSINQDGYLQGYAEPGSVISVYDADHQLIKEFTFYPSFPFPFPDIFVIGLDKVLTEGTQLFVVASKNGVESRTESVNVDFTPPAAASNLSFNDLGQLTGQAEANSFIQILDKNNNYVGSGQADDNGDFVISASTSFSGKDAFNNGELLKVMVTDHNRNTSDISEIQAPDFLVAPQVRSISKDGMVSGVAEAGSSIIIKDATGKVIASTDSQPDGRFTVKLPDVLKNGQEITVSASNSKGQTSADSTVVVDFKAPAAPHDLVFNAEGSLLIGKAEAFSSVNVSVNGQPLYDYRGVDANGNFTIQLDTPLHDGQKLTISVTDRNANQSKAVEITAPDYALAPIISGGIGLDNQLQGFINEPNATIIVKDADGKQLELKDVSISQWGALTATVVSPLTHGQQVSVIVVDARGHESKAVNVLVDLKAPKAVSEVALADDGQTISGHAEANAAIQVLDKQGLVVGRGYVNAEGEFNFKLFSFFLKGEALKVQVVDAAGNSSKLKSITAPIDNTAPAEAQDLVIDQYGRTLTGTGEANSRVYVYDAWKKEVASTVIGEDGKFSLSFWNEKYVQGEQLQVVVQDRAGNRSKSASVIAPLDQTAPDKATGLEVQQNGKVLTGMAEPFSVIKVRTSWGEIVGETSTDSDGNFEVYLKGVFLKEEALTIQVLDAAGNSSKVVKFVAPLDDLAPAQPSGVAVEPVGNVISGQAEAYSQIIIFNDKDVKVGEATVNSDGRFSVYTSSNYFLKGEQLKVVAVDAAGNSGAPIFVTAPVDTQAPEAARDIQVDENGNLVGNASRDDVIVLLKNQAGEVVSSTSPYDSTFSFYVNQFELFQGQDLFVVVADHAGNQSDPVTVKVPVDVDALPAPTNLVLSDNGFILTGIAPIGSDIRVFNSKGEQVSGYGRVDDNGNFTVQMFRPQLDGKPLAVYAYQDAKPGLAASIIAPLDNIAPAAPQIVSVRTEEGLIDSISGFAEKGSVVLLKDENGNIRDYTTASSDTGLFNFWGSHGIAGQKLTVVAVDAALNTSKPVAIVPPVSPQAPAAATDLHLAEDGLSLSGSALAHTKVIVFNNGSVAGTGATDGTGHFKVVFNSALIRGEILQVIVQKGPYYSLPTAIAAPVDTVAPDVATHLKMSVDGHVVTGRAEANASVSIRDEYGYWIGDGKVDASGVFKITLYNAYTKGQLLNVQVTDRAGNASEKVLLVAPADTLAPEIASNVVISTNGLSISGRAEAGTNIVVMDADNNQLNVWNTTVNDEGLFKLSLSKPLLEGKKFTLLVVDSAGNQSQALELTVATNSTLSKPAYIWFDFRGTDFSGAAEPGTKITVKDQDGKVLKTWWEISTSNSGVFSGELNEPLEPGQAVYLTATDAAGNESKPRKYVFEADRSSPAEATDLMVSLDGLHLTGSAEPLGRVEVRDARGNYVDSVTVDGYGKFNINLYRPYQSGELFKVIVFDRSGNASTVATTTAPRDEVAPEAATKLQFSDDGIVLSGLAEVGAYVRVLDKHGDQVNYDYDRVESNGQFTVTLDRHYLHGEKLKVVIEDLAGNQSVVKKVTAPLDVTAPEAAVALVFNQTGNSLYGMAEAGAIIRVLNADGNQVNYYYETADKDGFFATSLGSSYLKGEKLTVVVEDLAGNQSAPVTVVAPHDKTPPAAPNHLQFNKSGEYLTGFTEAYVTLTAKNAKGDVIGSSSSDSSGQFSFYFYKPLLQGQHVSVYAVDRAGNQSKATTITAPLDNTAPDSASNLSIVDNYLKGTAESGATVLLKDASGVQFSSTGAWSGTFNAYFDKDFYQGQDIQVVVVDKAGNQSAATTFSVPVNPDAPAVATALVFSDDGRYLSGKAEPGNDRVEVRDAQGEFYNEANIDKHGNFKVNLDENLLHGENLQHGETLTVRVVSNSGEYSPAVSVIVPLVAESQVQGVEDTNSGDITGVLEQADNQQVAVTVGTADSDTVNTGLIAQLLAENGGSGVTGLINSAIATQPQGEGQQGASVDAITAINITATSGLVSNTVDVASLLHAQQLLI